MVHRMGVSKNRGTPKWMVYNGNPMKMDDLGVPLFSETSILTLNDTTYFQHLSSIIWKGNKLKMSIIPCHVFFLNLKNYGKMSCLSLEWSSKKRQLLWPVSKCQQVITKGWRGVHGATYCKYSGDSKTLLEKQHLPSQSALLSSTIFLWTNWDMLRPCEAN